jgi:hypothetical protein
MLHKIRLSELGKTMPARAPPRSAARRQHHDCCRRIRRGRHRRCATQAIAAKERRAASGSSPPPCRRRSDDALGARAGAASARGFGDRALFAAYARTVRWGCVAATDTSLFQAPFRAGTWLPLPGLEQRFDMVRELKDG